MTTEGSARGPAVRAVRELGRRVCSSSSMAKKTTAPTYVLHEDVNTPRSTLDQSITRNLNQEIFLSGVLCNFHSKRPKSYIVAAR